MAFSFKSQIFSVTLIFLIAFSTSARILDEVAAPVPEADAPVADEAPATAAAASGAGVAGGAVATGGGAAGAATSAGGGAAGAATSAGGGAAGAATSAGGGAAGAATSAEGGATDAATSTEGGASGASTSAGGGAAGAATSTGGGAAGAAATKGGAASASALAAGDHPDLVFYMHDILGGSNPTAKAITGVVTNPAVSGQVPFAKPNGAVLPTNNGLPQNNGNSGIINNDNVPFLTGLGGVNPNVMQNNNGNNFVGGNGFPVVNGGQLSAGTTLQKLMFGTMIAVDDELTEGHALNSGMIGRAQGFYVYSSVDGKTQTMAFTAMFIEGGYHNSLNFFGVHQTVVSESVVAIMGGTGKYVNAKGFAVIKTLPSADQHETDGLQTVLEIAVFLTE